MYIEFGSINYKSIIHLLYPIFYHLRFRIGGDRNNFYQLFINYLSYSLAGIICLIIRYRTNSNDDTNKLVEKSSTEKPESLKLNLSIVALAILNFLPMSIETMLLNLPNLGLDPDIKESSTIFLETLFYVLFSRIFLKLKIYNHQILSLTMILCCMTSIFIIYLFENSLGFLEIMKNLMFFSLVFLFYGLYNVFLKKVLNSFIITPYYLMFLIGFSSLIVLMIYEIITCLIFGIDWEYNGVIKQIKNDFSIKFLLLLFFSAIIGLFWVLGIWLTIYYFSPCHFIINEVLTQLVTNLLDNRFGKYSITNEIICYVAYVIILFFSLIYNEIIIIGIDCISKDTRKSILKRQYDDDDKETLNRIKNTEIILPNEEK